VSTIAGKPIVVIAESHRAIADTLRDVVLLAGCAPVIIDSAEAVRNCPSPPTAIVIRVATEMPLMSPHLGLERLAQAERPMIVALTSSDEDVAEARRLQCEVIARAPYQIQALYETLTKLVRPGPSQPLDHEDAQRIGFSGEVSCPAQASVKS
jgi:hypothetical protein